MPPHLTKLPITSPTFWDLAVAISELSLVEQQALLAALQMMQHLRQTDPTWRAAHKLTLVSRQEEEL